MNKDPWQKKIAAFLGNEREKLVGYVRRFIDDTAERDGEDIVQDVILNIFNRADVTIPIENMAAYMYQALRNRIVDYLRKKRDTVSIDQEFTRTADLTLSDILPDPKADRFDEESRLEVRQNLFRALSILNDEQRAVVIETELEGRSFKALSEKWGVPVGTLLARKSRAIQKIRDSFSGLSD